MRNFCKSEIIFYILFCDITLITITTLRNVVNIFAKSCHLIGSDNHWKAIGFCHSSLISERRIHIANTTWSSSLGFPKLVQQNIYELLWVGLKKTLAVIFHAKYNLIFKTKKKQTCCVVYNPNIGLHLTNKNRINREFLLSIQQKNMFWFRIKRTAHC